MQAGAPRYTPQPRMGYKMREDVDILGDIIEGSDAESIVVRSGSVGGSGSINHEGD